MSERDTSVYVRVGIEDGQVMLLFTKDPEGGIPANISKWRSDPKECLDITEAMAAAAFEADGGLKPVGPALKANLIEQHRIKLTHRFALMLNTMHPLRMSDGEIAQKLVDAALQEIF